MNWTWFGKGLVYKNDILDMTPSGASQQSDRRSKTVPTGSALDEWEKSHGSKGMKSFLM